MLLMVPSMHKAGKQKIALLLMAAGSSSRLGQPKQLVEIAEKQEQPQSLLIKQIKLMNSICSSTSAEAFCVLGFQHEELTAHLKNSQLPKQPTLIINDNWSQGLSSSISKGVSALTLDISAVLVFLVDQWKITPADVFQLIDAWKNEPEKIHIACKENRISPPAIFPSSFFDELLTLTGDDGAKKVIRNNIDQVSFKTMPSAFFDLDTPQQLKQLEEAKLVTSI